MLRASILALAFALPLAAQAGVLYKSVDANGTVTFSDLPPAAGTKVLETRNVTASGFASVAPALPAAAAAPEPMINLFEMDAAVAKASAQLDQAERELALARKELWSPRDGLRLVQRRMTAADDARVEFFKRNVATARHALMELLRDRRHQMAANPLQPGDGRPRIIAMGR